MILRLEGHAPGTDSAKQRHDLWSAPHPRKGLFEGNLVVRFQRRRRLDAPTFESLEERHKGDTPGTKPKVLVATSVIVVKVQVPQARGEGVQPAV